MKNGVVELRVTMGRDAGGQRTKRTKGGAEAENGREWRVRSAHDSTGTRVYKALGMAAGQLAMPALSRIAAVQEAQRVHPFAVDDGPPRCPASSASLVLFGVDFLWVNPRVPGVGGRARWMGRSGLELGRLRALSERYAQEAREEKRSAK